MNSRRGPETQPQSGDLFELDHDIRAPQPPVDFQQELPLNTFRINVWFRGVE
jgi:hypothetical protein